MPDAQEFFLLSGHVVGIYFQYVFKFFFWGKNCLAVHLRNVRKLTDANDLPPFGWLPRSPSLRGICGAEAEKFCFVNTADKNAEKRKSSGVCLC